MFVELYLFVFTVTQWMGSRVWEEEYSNTVMHEGAGLVGGQR